MPSGYYANDGSQNVTIVGGSMTYAPFRGVGSNRSLTVGTSASVAMAANVNRQGWKIKNDSAGDIWINFDTTATTVPGGGNIKVPAGGYIASEPSFVETGAMSVIGATTGLNVTIREY